MPHHIEHECYLDFARILQDACGGCSKGENTTLNGDPNQTGNCGHFGDSFAEQLPCMGSNVVGSLTFKGAGMPMLVSKNPELGPS